MRPSHILTILDREFTSCDAGHHTPVMLWGPPGVGKSQIVAKIAAQHQVPLIDIRLSQMEPTDLRGIPFRSGNLVEWSIPSVLPNAERHGPAGILFLDEITSAPPTVSAAAYQLILDRRLGEYEVPPGWVIFAAGNRQGDRGVTYAMPAPLANRFTHYTLEAFLDDWVDWAYENGIDSRVVAFLRFRPDLIFSFDPAHVINAFPSPRSWEFAHRALQKFDKTELLSDSLVACVGESAGLAFRTFVENMNQMPDIDAILAGDANVEVPNGTDLQYGVCTALIRKAIDACKADPANSTQVFVNILKYAQRFQQREIGVMLVFDAYGKLQKLIKVPLTKIPEFQVWSNVVSELVL